MKILYGTSQRLLTRRCLQEVKEVGDGKIFMIVPEQFSLSSEREFVSEPGLPVGFEVSSFRRLSHMMFEQCGCAAGGYINNSSKVMVMQDVLNHCRSNLSVYQNSIEKDGFCPTMCKTVAEFKHAAVTPQMLLDKSEEIEDGYLKSKLSDFAQIFTLYDKALARIGRDADDDLSLFAQMLEGGQIPPFLKNAYLYIDHFSGFTMQEHRLLSCLSRVCRQVVVTLVTDTLEEPANSCFLPTVRNARRLLADGDVQTILVENIESLRENSLQRLVDGYFTYPHPSYEKEPDGIVLTAAESRYAEAEAVACRIWELCRVEGMRYRQFAVTARGLEGYTEVLQSVFLKFGIPLFLDQRLDVLNHPFIGFVLSVGELFEYRFQYDAVCHYIKSEFCTLTTEEADVLENFALAYGIRGEVWLDDTRWSDRMDRIFSRDCSYQRGEIDALRDRFVFPLKAFRETTKGARPFREHATTLFSMLEQLNAGTTILERSERLNELGELRTAEEYRQIWNLFIEVLDETVSLLGETRGSYARFAAVLKAGLSECSVGVAPPVLDSVTVTAADHFVGGDVDVLFVLGANEGEFPAMQSNSGLLDGMERDILEKMGIETATSRMKSPLIEEQILYKVLATPGKRIYISYRQSDSDGSVQAPSTIISNIRGMFPALSCHQWEEQVSAPAYTFEKLVQKEPAGDWADASVWFQKQPVWKDRLMRAGSGEAEQEITLSEEMVRQIYPDGLYTSISRLERYSRCAFSYHVQYVLRARERQVYRLGAPDVGILVHEALELCSRRIEESNRLTWRSVTTEECNELAQEAVGEIAGRIAGGLFMSSARYSYLTGRLKKLLAKNLYYISTHFKRGLFEPFGYELVFSEKGELPPVTLHTDEGKKIVLNGKVDRADTYKTPDGSFIRIVDYKSGPKDLVFDDMYYGLNIQLVTYLDALCRDIPQAQPAGTFYFSVNDPYMRSNIRLEADELVAQLQKNYKMRGLVLADSTVLYAMDQECDKGSDIIPAYVKKDGSVGGAAVSPKEFSLMRQHIRKTLRELSNEIVRGRIDVNPVLTKRESACDYCKFGAVCGFDRHTMGCRRLAELGRTNVMERLEKEANGDNYAKKV